MSRITVIVIVAVATALAAVATVEAILLYESRADAERLRARAEQFRASDHKRKQFCTLYHFAMTDAPQSLRDHLVSARRVAYQSFSLMAIPMYFDACDVAVDQELYDELDRAHYCYVMREDYDCVADVADKLARRVPLPK